MADGTKVETKVRADDRMLSPRVSLMCGIKTWGAVLAGGYPRLRRENF